MNVRQKILSIFRLKGNTVRDISSKIDIPKSTVHYHGQKTSQRIEASGTGFWESDLGYQFIIRLVISTIYMFAIKSGIGAGRIKEFFDLLELKKHTAVSESTILKIIRRVEGLILEYRQAAQGQIKSRVKEIELILGVDETWFDNMYLVCQELSSGYIFFETKSEQRDAATWDMHIKKTLGPAS